MHFTRHLATAPTAPPRLGTAQHLPPGGLIAIAWPCIVLAGMFVAARTVIRITRDERLGWVGDLVAFAYAVLILTVILQTLKTLLFYYLIKGFSSLVPFGEKTVIHGK